jgi:hypothetical protein
VLAGVGDELHACPSRWSICSEECGFGQAIGLFAVTNIDDIVVLSVFFGRSRGVPGSTRRIVIGQ